MFGVINIIKPLRWTSHGAVSRVERLVRPAKAGHAGTLDPLASGVLVVCLGPATRLIEYVQQMPKQYHATFLLGQRSASDDLETEVELLEDAPQPSLEQLSAALKPLIGTIQQRPPAYSAAMIGGRRAYKLARRGEAFTLDARSVEIYSLEIQRYDYPQLELAIRCGSGTYVRSLGRDLAHSLGTAAVMSALVRTAVGDFRLEDSLPANKLDDVSIREHCVSPMRAVAHLPRVVLPPERAKYLERGGLISRDELDAAGVPTAAAIAALDEQGRLVAILKEARPGLFKPAPNFPQAE